MLTLLLSAALLAGPPEPHACPSGETWSLRAAEWACRPDLEVHPKITQRLSRAEVLLPFAGQLIDATTTQIAISRVPPGVTKSDINPMMNWAIKHPAAFWALKLGGGAWMSYSAYKTQSRARCWIGFGTGMVGTTITLTMGMSW